ncbi:vitamin D3 receptor B-like isoform X2 [Acanthaster planci]|uniref:Vitamin D3 receptor B-like isoform X2 n=1 Tax=Acanthaster planci TaxID=133434 RepID=A0A8B7ZT96_ACAPL|nr:vitamin D3 receptor B-like isoform X2 [Acanthaster planci]
MEVFWKKIVENEDLFTGFEKMSMDYSKQKCLVCGDKASGLHYTVVSCESCKSFFGRKIKSKAKFTCEANGNCVMDLYTRRHCPACRLKKCLDVGMKPERVWDEKRLETRKPLERKNKKKNNQVPPPPPPQQLAPPVSTSVSTPETTPVLSRDQEELIDSLKKAKYDALHTSAPVKPTGRFDEILQKMMEALTGQSGMPPGGGMMDMSNMMKFPGFCGMPGHKQNGVRPHGPMDLSQLCPPMAPGFSGFDMSQLPGENCNNSSSEHSSESHPETAPPQPEMRIKQEVVDMGYENISDKHGSSCMGNVELKPEARVLPASATHMKPCITQEMIIYNMTLLGVVIRQTVAFTKAIPAFRNLSYEDQAVLVKNAILEILMIRCAENYIPERNSIVDDITGSEWSIEAMLASGFATSAQPSLKFVQALHSMQLTKEEYALLQAITIISPDRPDIENHEDVERIQRPMVETLQMLTKVNHPEDKVFFAKLIMKLTDVRDLVTRHINDLMQMKLPDSQFENLFPLITEIFNV